MLEILLFFTITILATTGAQLLFKKGALNLGNLDLSFSGVFYLILKIFQNGYLIGGIFLFGIGFIFWLFILSKLQLNLVYPVAFSLSSCLIIIASWFLFKEYLSSVQILGIAIIIIGIFLLFHKELM